MRPFSVTAGSIVGREHVRLARNNQDGVGIHVEADLIAAAVTDGCSSCRASEVGARLAAEWLAAAAPRYVADVSAGELARSMTRGLLDFVAGTARALSPSGAVSPEAIGDFFLFTMLVAIVTPARTIVFGIGDGVFAINGKETVLLPGPDNTPSYPAYGLLDREELACELAAPEPVVHAELETGALRSLIIATDGAAELALEDLAHDPGYRTNATLLHKRLNVISARDKKLYDDTSLVLIRREVVS